MVGAYLAVAITTANLSGWGQWTRDFTKSPGAAAFAALVAAAIAFCGISKQVTVSRASLDHERKATRAVGWWAMFEWASDRALPARREDRPLPTSVTIRTLQRLADDATSSVQEAACAGVIDILTQSIDTTGPLSADAASPEPAASAAVEALASYVQASRGTPAASAAAEALLYEHQVLTALAQLSHEEPTVTIFKNPPSSGDSADAVAEVDGQRVIIEIKYRTTAQGHAKMAAQTLDRMRARGQSNDAYLLVTPFPSPLRPNEESGLRAVATQWVAPKDTPSLLAALRHASALG